jgi:hypothetical protein
MERVVDLLGDVEHWDLAVPVIDGVPLSERLRERAAGTWTALVAAPSRHWLGQPAVDLDDDHDGRAEVLTGTCGQAGCCGVFARIVIGDATVRWEDFSALGGPPLPDDLAFEFDRAEYEAAIDRLADLPVQPSK